MAQEVDDYVSQLSEPYRSRIGDIYSMARRVVPGAVDGVSYGMPALLYKGKGLLAVMSTRNHIGIYPFGSLGEFAGLAADSGLETTKSSIHLREGQALPEGLLERLLARSVITRTPAPTLAKADDYRSVAASQGRALRIYSAHLPSASGAIVIVWHRRFQRSSRSVTNVIGWQLGCTFRHVAGILELPTFVGAGPAAVREMAHRRVRSAVTVFLNAHPAPGDSHA